MRQESAEDFNCLVLACMCRIAHLIKQDMSDPQKFMIAGCVFNVLTGVGKDTKEQIENFMSYANVAERVISDIVRSREDCELISFLADQYALQKGMDIAVSSRSARLHGVYVEATGRNINSFDEASRLCVPSLNLQGGTHSSSQESVPKTGCMVMAACCGGIQGAMVYILSRWLG